MRSQRSAPGATAARQAGGAAASGNTDAILNRRYTKLVVCIGGGAGGRPRGEAAEGPVGELPARVTGLAVRRLRFTHGRRVRTPSV